MPTTDMFEVTPIIETPHLRLRGLHLDDAEAFFAIQADLQAMQYFIQEPFTRLKQAQTYIENARQQQQIRERVTWTAVHKEQQQVIGRINLHSWRRQHQCVEVGYILGHANWGQGYGTEMLRGVVRYVFRNTAVNRIEANCLSDNHASYRVMEKAGMSFEGIARQRYFINNIYQDVRRYAILKEDYLSPQSTYL